MKKRWLKILAMALVGVMMLCMTACDQDDVEEILPLPTEEVAARAAILDEINAYRAEIGVQELKEEPQLEELWSTITKQFETRNVLRLPEVDVDYELYDSLLSGLVSKWKIDHDGVGVGFEEGRVHTLKFEYVDRLTLREQIRSSGKLKSKEYDLIGIVFVKVDGKTYWTAQVAQTLS